MIAFYDKVKKIDFKKKKLINDKNKRQKDKKNIYIYKYSPQFYNTLIAENIKYYISIFLYQIPFN